jgi:hypothetical protein
MLGPCNLFLISKHCRDKIKKEKKGSTQWNP